VDEDLLSGSEAEDYGKPVHFRENCRNPGYVIYTVRAVYNEICSIKLYMCIV